MVGELWCSTNSGEKTDILFKRKLGERLFDIVHDGLLIGGDTVYSVVDVYGHTDESNPYTLVL